MDYVEEKGYGMKVLKSMYEKYNLPLPEYSFVDPFLSLSFPRNMKAIADASEHKRIGELTDDELSGYEWIKSQGEVSAKDYKIRFGVTARTASRHLGKMLEFHLVKSNGENPKSPKLRYSAT
jgi:ATP-dependent DNA helicase RecG